MKALLITYLNGYDREYDENGTIDNYKGKTSGLKYDFSQNLTKNSHMVLVLTTNMIGENFKPR